MKDEMELILQDAINLQKTKLVKCAESLIPNITEEDILQPNDFPELENHPYFRHEEGVLEGLLSALAAYSAHKKQK